MIKILYISLTGMTEPLGRSQVLEYLMDLSKDNAIYLISFERESDLQSIEEIQAFIKNFNIQWTYLIYSNKYGVFSTIVQITKGMFLGSAIIKKYSIDLIHARSMIPATIGLILKKIHGIKLLFDIRGFSIDEKVDSGRLSKTSFLYKVLKRLDNYLYKASDHIVTLTHVADRILQQQLNISKDKITVIPTCANKDIFKVLNDDDKEDFKRSLGYTVSDKIIIHTGTVGGWYDFESELKYIKEMMSHDEHIHFLILNKNEHEFIQNKLNIYDMPKEKVKISSSTFDEMYKYLNIAEASIFFITPSFSKQASAPTKFAENVACYLPSITNTHVGDIEYYVSNYNVGTLIDLKNINERKFSLSTLCEKIQIDRKKSFDNLFFKHFDKNIAVNKYHNIYVKLVKNV